MSKGALTVLIALLLVLTTASSAFAAIDAEFEYNRNVFEIEVYDCQNADCSRVAPFSGTLPEGTSSTDGNINILFPNNHPRHGYAIFAFADEFLAVASRLGRFNNLPETTSVVTRNYGPLNFVKVHNCKSDVDRFTIADIAQPHLPVQVDFEVGAEARTQGAFEVPAGHPVQFFPADTRREFYSTDLRVTFEVFRTNNANARIFSEVREYSSSPNADGPSLLQGQHIPVSFTFTPREDGDFTAAITTEVIDDQCSLPRIPQTATTDFVILEDLEDDRVVTQIQDLHVFNPDRSDNRRQVGDTLRLRFLKRSNLITANGANLDPVGTIVTITIEDENGNVVREQTASLDPNRDEFEMRAFDFDYRLNEPGIYTFTVSGEGVFPSGVNRIPNNVGAQSVEVRVTPPGQAFTTIILKDSFTSNPIRLATVNVGGLVGTTDDDGKVTLGPLALGQHGVVATHPQYLPITNGVVNVYEAPDQVNIFTMVFVGGDAPEEPEEEEEEVVVDTGRSAETDAQFSRVNIRNAYNLRAGERVDVTVNLENVGSNELDRARVITAIPSLSLWRTDGPFELRGGDSKRRTVSMYLPPSMAPGQYYVMITLHSDNFRDTIWRDIYVR